MVSHVSCTSRGSKRLKKVCLDKFIGNLYLVNIEIRIAMVMAVSGRAKEVQDEDLSTKES
jgi:hypothetical protein